MALDVSLIQKTSPMQSEEKRRAQIAADQAAVAKAAATKTNEAATIDLKTAIRDIQRVSEAFNRRLSFSINEKLGQVVVKVIDNDTDKVVREIPPTELQHVYERIREAIGLLLDESA
jgi:flagellar protein FlaG